MSPGPGTPDTPDAPAPPPISRGRLEVAVQGIWGSVCADHFGAGGSTGSTQHRGTAAPASVAAVHWYTNSAIA